MNLDRMLIHSWKENKDRLRFKYYGEFDTMKWIAKDCIEDLQYIGNSNIDGAPIFVYTFDNIDTNLLRDFKELNVYLRELKIRHYTKKDLTKKEQSILTFFKFFMNSDENFLIKGVSNSEIKDFTEIKNYDKED
jgi:hypothetical protein